ncbi:MAG TPA: (E)-4-hydroxy-3-methylbut-2-enyl-diphosphate synthase, partial [Salinivirgaceae bacterium]|nr:(E)-4-hydroxy-3-methylbut-2-enyl-diphosphate synthase [Salinivirgaceae bacterium]
MIFTSFSIKRFPTHEVKIGNITIGGDSDIVIQTMCNTPAGDVEAGYKQSKEVISAGAQMVRFAVRNRADAESIGKIKELLLNDNINTSLVADVHFSSQAAFVAAKLVDKVRINPGNFIDKRATFDTKTYTELEWKEELDKIELTLNELIDICVAHDTALRIGVNHGSLSDRIMSKYGNTTEGMVESAMEFLRICKKRDFQNVVISLKSSNIRIMNSAYFMLAKQMQVEDMHYPLHLGVTEAGNDLSGRVRSAIGIGRLLGHGIGDTIRISLTENPVKEIPAAQKLVNHFKHRKPLTDTNNNWEEYNPLDFSFYYSHEVGNIGGENPVIAVCDIRNYRVLDNVMLEKLGYKFNGKKWIPTSQAADAVYVKDIEIITELPENLSVIYEAGTTKMPCENATPLFNNLEF